MQLGILCLFFSLYVFIDLRSMYTSWNKIWSSSCFCAETGQILLLMLSSANTNVSTQCHSEATLIPWQHSHCTKWFQGSRIPVTKGHSAAVTHASCRPVLPNSAAVPVGAVCEAMTPGTVRTGQFSGLPLLPPIHPASHYLHRVCTLASELCGCVSWLYAHSGTGKKRLLLLKLK